MSVRIVDLTAGRADLVTQATALLHDAFHNRTEDWQDLKSTRLEVLETVFQPRWRVRRGTVLTWIPTIRKCLLVAAVASLLAAAPPAASLQTTAHDGCDANRHASPADDVSLRAVASAWKDAYNAGHAERVSSLYTNDGQYLSAHVHARGREAIRAYFQRGIDAGGHIEGIRVLDTKSNGNLAYAVGTYDANNAGQRVDGRLLLVLENCDGGWRIAAHEVVVRDQP